MAAPVGGSQLPQGGEEEGEERQRVGLATRGERQEQGGRGGAAQGGGPAMPLLTPQGPINAFAPAMRL